MKKLLISFFLMSTLVANASSGTAKSSFSINASVISDPISVSASNVDFGLVNRGDTAFSSSDILVDGDYWDLIKELRFLKCYTGRDSDELWLELMGPMPELEELEAEGIGEARVGSTGVDASLYKYDAATGERRFLDGSDTSLPLFPKLKRLNVKDVCDAVAALEPWHAPKLESVDITIDSRHFSNESSLGET